MRTVLFLIGGIVLGSIVWATAFHIVPPKAAAQESIVNAATREGQDPWMTNEPAIAKGRDSQRKHALAALGRPWSEFCTAGGRKQLASALNEYWYHRSVQISGYPKTWGETARPYIVKAWATADDSRIERLVREAYGNGYVDLADLRPHTRVAMAMTLGGERVRGTPCANLAALRQR